MQAYCEGSLRGMRLAGGVTAAYLNANPWYSVNTTHADAMRAIGTELENLNFIVIDFELRPEPADHIGAGHLMAHTSELIERVRGSIHPDTRLIGYSADWFLGFFKTLGWSGYFPQLDGYWYARYDGVPDLYVNSPNHTMDKPVVGKQYMNDTHFDGKVTDLNIFDDAWLLSPIIDGPEEEEEMTITLDQIRQVVAEEQHKLVANTGTDRFKSLQSMMGPRLVHFRHPASGHVYHVDVDRGYLVHDLNPTVFLGGGSRWEDIIDLDPTNSDHVEIMGLPVLYGKGLAHTAKSLGR